MKRKEISQSVKTPQVNQKIEVSLWDPDNGRKNHIVKIIKIRKNYFTIRHSFEYLCEFENLERRWYDFSVMIWPKD